MYHICENLKVLGFQTDGTAQDFFPLPVGMVFRLPTSMSLDHAAMIEPISVAVHAVLKAGDVRDKRVLVLGAGTIGNLVAQVARAFGAKAVMITDVKEYKLAKARACGIEFAINTAQTGLEQAILEHFGPDRADLILECVGAQVTITQAVNYARKGTTIVVVGVFGDKPVVDLGLVQDRELKLVGTLMYQNSDYEVAIDLVKNGKMQLDTLITHRFKFDQYPAAYQAIEESDGEYMKVMIELE
jgi:L-iditol 2-dehydrogenase